MAGQISIFPAQQVNTTGLATASNQVLEIAALNSIDTKLTAPLSVTVTGSLPLPTGAATAALQTTGNTSLSNIDSSTANIDGKIVVVDTSDVSVTSTVLAPDAATETTLLSIDAKVPANLTVTSTRLLVDGSGVTQPVSAVSLPLPTGASTEATLSTLNGKIPSNLTVTATRLLVDGSGVTQPVSISGTVATTSGAATTSSVTSVSGSATSVSILASNSSRKNATFYNDSTATLYLKLGTTASTTSYTIQLPPQGYYEIPVGAVYTGAIDGIWSSATGAVLVTELS